MNAPGTTPRRAPAEPPTVFISYAREDRMVAQRFAKVLGDRRWRVWWDAEIDGGKPFGDVIEEMLTKARLVVVLWSDHSIESTFVRDEAARALKMQKLLPVRITDVELPIGFGQIHTLDLLNWRGADDDAALIAVIDEIGDLVGRAPSPPPAPAAGDANRPRRRLGIVLASLAIAGAMAFAVSRFQHPVSPQNASTLTLQGIERLEAKEYAKARYLFNQAAQADPGFAPSYYYLAQVLIQTGADNEAARYLQQALSLESGLDGAQIADAKQWLARLDTNAGSTPASSPAGSAANGSTASAHGDQQGQMAAVALSGQPLVELEKVVDAMFSPVRETRTLATTSLLLDPERLSDAVPIAVARALKPGAGVVSTPAGRSGIINTMVLLQAARPATLNRHRADVETLVERARAIGGQAASQADRLQSSLRTIGHSKPVVLLRIADETQRAWAASCAAVLKRAGLDVPDIEAAADPAPVDRSEIRVHGSSDRALARWLAGLATSLGAASPTVVTLRDRRTENDTYELWLDRGLCVNAARRGASCTVSP
jgi:hypothetical protein